MVVVVVEVEAFFELGSEVRHGRVCECVRANNSRRGREIIIITSQGF